MSAGGCGSQEKAPHTTKVEDPKVESPYVEALLGFRDAARSDATYDAYGYAEYLPDSQRAAIGAFCLVVSGVRTSSESRRLSDPAYFSAQVVNAARPEARSASMASVGRAVGKLQTVVEAESLNPQLVKSYAKACY